MNVDLHILEARMILVRDYGCLNQQPRPVISKSKRLKSCKCDLNQNYHALKHIN